MNNSERSLDAAGVDSAASRVATVAMPATEGQMEPERLLTVWNTLLMLVVAGTGTVLALTLSLQRLISGFFDDSFFYIKTANNIASGLGSTFDGVNLTNGYHPLYMALLVGLAKIVPLRGVTGIRTVAAFDLLLLGIALATMEAALRTLRVRPLPRAAALLATLVAVGMNDFGIEAKLYVPLAWLLMFAVYHHRGTPGQTLSVAVLALAVSLSRLEALPLAALLCAIAAWNSPVDPRRAATVSPVSARLRIFATFIGPAVVAISVYALINYLLFSHPGSISSWLKSGLRNRRGLAAFENIGLRVRVAICAGTIALFLVLSIRDAWRRQLDRADAVLSAAGCFVMLYILLLFAFSRGGVMSWYLALPMTISIAVSTRLWVRLTSSRSWVRLRTIAEWAGVVFIVALGIAFVRYKFRPNNPREIGYGAIEIGQWMKRNLPPAARVYQVDLAGIPGYFSERSVINGDGLINSWQYQGFLRRGELPRYLAQCDVQYFMVSAYHDQQTIEIPLPFWDGPDRWITFARPPEKVQRAGNFLLLRVDPADLVVREAPLSKPAS